MMNDFYEMIDKVIRCPEMFGCERVRDVLRCIEGMSIGYSMASGNACLEGFQEWIESRYKCSGKMYWGDVLEIHVPSVPDLKEVFDSFHEFKK